MDYNVLFVLSLCPVGRANKNFDKNFVTESIQKTTKAKACTSCTAERLVYSSYAR